METIEMEYIIKFYDGISLVHRTELVADNSKDAVKIAIDNIRGMIAFDRIKIVKLSGMNCKKI
jgi:hypothetical protein